MLVSRTCSAVTSVLIAAAICPTAAAAPDDKFYKGAQITMIIGTPSGTGNDVWGRFIARHMPNHIPGKPGIVVQNMPGAGTINAANYLFNRAPKDGTVMGNISRNLVTADIMGRKNIRFELLKFAWIGSPEIENRVCVASTTSGVKSVQDIFRKELVVGGTGGGTMPTLLPGFINKFAGTKFKVVGGYPGSSDVMLALDRHEVDGVCVTLGLFKGPYAYLLEQNKARILFNSEPDRIDGMPDVPSIFDFIKNEDDKKRLNFLVFSVQIGRPFVLPPDVPAERTATLRKAFADTMQDKAFRAEAAKQGLEITYRSGDQLESVVRQAYATPKEIIDEVKTLIPEGGGD